MRNDYLCTSLSIHLIYIYDKKRLDKPLCNVCNTGKWEFMKTHEEKNLFV